MVFRTRLSRRGFIRFITALLVPAAPGLTGCDDRRGTVDTRTLEALLDAFIPADRDPGALQAGVLEVILGRIRGNRVEAKRYRRLLARLNQRAWCQQGQPFHRLPAAQRTGLLNNLYHARGQALTRTRGDLHIALQHCFHAFYSSPAAERVIGYHPPIEGGYPDYGRAPGSTV